VTHASSQTRRTASTGRARDDRRARPLAVLPTAHAGGSRPPPPPRARPRPPVLRTPAVVGLRGRASPWLRGERPPPQCQARNCASAAAHARPAAAGTTDGSGLGLSAARASRPPYTAVVERKSLRCLHTPVARSPSLPRSERHGPKKRNFRGRAARTAARDRGLATQLAIQLRSSTTYAAKAPTRPADAPARE